MATLLVNGRRVPSGNRLLSTGTGSRYWFNQLPVYSNLLTRQLFNLSTIDNVCLRNVTLQVSTVTKIGKQISIPAINMYKKMKMQSANINPILTRYF